MLAVRFSLAWERNRGHSMGVLAVSGKKLNKV